MKDTTAEISPDELLSTIADDRCREVLRVVLETPGTISLKGLAAEISRREAGSDRAHALKRIKITLYHFHIPALVDAGLIAYIASDNWMELTYTGSPDTTALLTDMLATE